MKHLRTKIFRSIFIILTLIIVIEGLLSIEYRNKYYEVQSSYIKLERELNILQNQYTGLGKDYDRLQSRYNALEESYSGLQTYSISPEESINQQGDYVSQREYIIKMTSYLALFRESYTNLRKNYDTEVSLRIGNNLESYYDILRYEKNLITSNWQDVQREADFCAQLALHDLGYNCWPTLENKYYIKTAEHSYEIARKKINEVINIIELKAYHPPTYKIKKILEYIQQNIHYEYDFVNSYLAPVETLGFKSGDCDDFSILASALFKAVGIDSAFAIFENNEGKYHCMVLVHLEDLGGYPYYSYPDLTDKKLDKGTWIVIEPQSTIDQQYFDSFNMYSLVAVAPLD